MYRVYVEEDGDTRVSYESKNKSRILREVRRLIKWGVRAYWRAL